MLPFDVLYQSYLIDNFHLQPLRQVTIKTYNSVGQHTVLILDLAKCIQPKAILYFISLSQPNQVVIYNVKFGRSPIIWSCCWWFKTAPECFAEDEERLSKSSPKLPVTADSHSHSFLHIMQHTIQDTILYIVGNHQRKHDNTNLISLKKS